MTARARVPVRPVGVGVQPERAVEEEQAAEVGELGVHRAPESRRQAGLEVATEAVLEEQRADVVGVAGPRGRDIVAAAGEGKSGEGQCQESFHGCQDYAGSVPESGPRVQP